VLENLRGIVEYGLRYLGDDEVKLQRYTDLEWAGIAADGKSTSGCCFRLGSVMISWFSRKLTLVALILARAKFMAASTASCKAIWLRKLLARLFDHELDPTVIYYDNQSCIKLSENPIFHDKSKHL
jgi:hypothetical protein